MELALQSRASITGESGETGPKNQSASQEDAIKASTTRILRVMLNYWLDLSNYAGISNVLSNSCIA